MNKQELISKMAQKTEMSHADVGKVLTAFLGTVTEAMAGGDKLTLVGFGTFSTTARGERTGRNPQTGATLLISARTVCKFKPGTKLVEAVNK